LDKYKDKDIEERQKNKGIEGCKVWLVTEKDRIEL
jgi:hypothetical protein